MPSQIKVDEIKNVAGQYKIKTNVFEGQTTAGSITVQSEGTATTNLQQGLTKVWCKFDQINSNTTRDSFNVSSVTDVNTGRHAPNFTNNMNGTNTYSAYFSSQAQSSNIGFQNAVYTSGTSSSMQYNSYDNSAFRDTDFGSAISGDLA